MARNQAQLLELCNTLWGGKYWPTCIQRLAYKPLKELAPRYLEGRQENPVWRSELGQINRLGHRRFTEGASLLGDVLTIPQGLIDWQQASPTSWLVCKEEQRGEAVLGYVHVEPLSHEIGDRIVAGSAHEGQIGLEHILGDKGGSERDYIHIGCICASDEYVAGNQKLATTVALLLLLGIVDRVWELGAGTGPKQVLAVDYPAKPVRPLKVGLRGGAAEDVRHRPDGRHHAAFWLSGKYGFRKVGACPEGDIYVLDLRGFDPPSCPDKRFVLTDEEKDSISVLLDAVAIIQANTAAGGKSLGPPDPNKTTEERIREAIPNPEFRSIGDVARILNMSRPSLYRYVDNHPDLKNELIVAGKFPRKS
jgi:hypothetical protein